MISMGIFWADKQPFGQCPAAGGNRPSSSPLVTAPKSAERDDALARAYALLRAVGAPQTGLVWMLESRTVVALTATSAAIQRPSGNVRIYRKLNKQRQLGFHDHGPHSIHISAAT